MIETEKKNKKKQKTKRKKKRKKSVLKVSFMEDFEDLKIDNLRRCEN